MSNLRTSSSEALGTVVLIVTLTLIGVLVSTSGSPLSHMFIYSLDSNTDDVHWLSRLLHYNDGPFGSFCVAT